MASSFFHSHAHSSYSALDGMPLVKQMVGLVVDNNQPALALTDHGVMSGSIQLYKACMASGIIPFPGIEAYIVYGLGKDEERYHLGLLALNHKGYKAIGALSTMSYDHEHYHRKPRITFGELIEFGKQHGKNVALTSGCYFGLVIQSLIRFDATAARAILKNLANAFLNTYVELQDHKTKHKDGWTDSKINDALLNMAHGLSLPVVVSNDSHYCDHGDKAAHDLMKRMIMQNKADDTDMVFPGDDYSLCATGPLRRKFLPKHWERAEEGFKDLLDKNTLKMPALDSYKFHMPEVSLYDSNKVLAKKARHGLWMKHLIEWNHYENRMRYELGIIKTMGMADYFLFVADYVAYCNKNNILVEARGSANGSLICFALGITQIDPLEWDISFDRFLHPSRQKPPDIDLDIERDRRAEVIDYIGTKHEIVPIGTFSTLADTGDRGSIFVKYLAYKRRILTKEEYTRQYGQMASLWDLKRTDPADTAVLRSLADMRVLTGGGTHAAGYLVSTKKHPISDYIPLMLVGGQNGNTVTQMSDKDCEDAGYVKADLLGQASLTTMRACMDMLGIAGLEDIPYNDKKALALMRSGKTMGIFQYEGYSTLKGAKEMRVMSTKDAIYCLALYRPAAMKSGHTDQYIARRRKQEDPSYLHDSFKRVTEDTFGVFVIQDQVIDVLRGLGMSYEDLNDMLKAIKSSNNNIAAAEATFERIKPNFLRLCVAAGMDAPTARKAWEQVMDFSDYGFNKAHATGYGIRACRSAYLKAHHPLEFMCALLITFAGDPKERDYATEARRLGLSIIRPDVQTSGVNWRTDKKRNGLRKGLLSVKGVGWKSAQELVDKQPFESIEDLIERCDGGPGMVTGGKSWHKTKTLNGVLGHLLEAGALRSFDVTNHE